MECKVHFSLFKEKCLKEEGEKHLKYKNEKPNLKLEH